MRTSCIRVVADDRGTMDRSSVTVPPGAIGPVSQVADVLLVTPTQPCGDQVARVTSMSPASSSSSAYWPRAVTVDGFATVKRADIDSPTATGMAVPEPAEPVATAVRARSADGPPPPTKMYESTMLQAG